MVSKTVSALAIGLAYQIAGAAALTQCVIPSKWNCSNGTACDSPAIQETFARCSKDSEIIFSEGVDYNVCTPISQTNLSNVVVRHLGNLHIPQDIPYVQNQVANNSGNYWWTLKGNDVSWIGTPNVSSGGSAMRCDPGLCCLCVAYQGNIAGHKRLVQVSRTDLVRQKC